MAKFYFTYGSSGQPFVGGWTEVEAPDRHMACEAFRIFHPNKTEGLLNCCSVYSQEEFLGTGMVSGNFGACCHEYISLKQAKKGYSWHEELVNRLLSSCFAVNDYAADGDVNRNHTNYGQATAWARLLVDLGHKVDMPCVSKEDNDDLLIIRYIIIDGKRFQLKEAAEPVKEAVQ